MSADRPATNSTTLVGPLADLIADVVEADGAHPWDDGFCEQLRRDGFTKAGRRRLIEQMRECAKLERQNAG